MDSTLFTSDDGFSIIKSFFDQFSVVRHQIEGYNDFIHNLVPLIINDSEAIAIQKDNKTYEYKFSNPIFHPCLTNGSEGPRRIITPNECRQKNLTYASNLQVDVIVTETDNISGVSNTNITSVIMAKIPIMLRSDICILHNKSKMQLYEFQEGINDPGGYFIINGLERALAGQERMASNYPFVLDNKNGILTAEIRSINEYQFKNVSKCEIRYYQHSKKNTVIIDKTFRVICGKMTKDVPLFVMIRALGVTDTKEILNLCTPVQDNEVDKLLTQNILEASIEESYFVNTEESAMMFIAKALGMNNFENIEKVMEVVNRTLDEDLLPHEGIDKKDRLSKARFLGYMTQKAILVIEGKRSLDDRDHFGNKRVDSSGHLLASLFRMSFAKQLRNIKTDLEKRILNNKVIQIEQDFSYNKLNVTKEIMYSMSTGNWSINRQKVVKTGISQILNRLSYIVTLSFLRKLVTPSSKNSKLAKPRQLHTTSWGYVDPHETPEGQPCGFIKYLSILSYLTIGSYSELIRKLIAEKGFMNDFTKEYKIFVNGQYIGTTDDYSSTYKLFKSFKYKGIPSYDTSVYYNKFDKEIRVNTEVGRYSRAVLVVNEETGKLVATPEMMIESIKAGDVFMYLLKRGAIEYIDPLESENALIAIDIDKVGRDGKKYTHAEIHPTVFMGIITNLIPFMNHNPGPRISFSCSMQKQAMGLYTTNYLQRTDTNVHVLYSPQKQLVRSEYADIFNLDEQPSGQLAIVAVLCYGGLKISPSYTQKV